LSRNTSTASSRGASSLETTIPIKQRYRPKLSIVHTSLVTPTRSRPYSQAILSGGLGTSDVESPNGASASPVSRQVEEEAETESFAADEAPEVLEIEDSIRDSQQGRPKRMKTRKRGRRGRDFLDI